MGQVTGSVTATTAATVANKSIRNSTKTISFGSIAGTLNPDGSPIKEGEEAEKNEATKREATVTDLLEAQDKVKFGDTTISPQSAERAMIRNIINEQDRLAAQFAPGYLQAQSNNGNQGQQIPAGPQSFGLGAGGASPTTDSTTKKDPPKTDKKDDKENDAVDNDNDDDDDDDDDTDGPNRTNGNNSSTPSQRTPEARQ